MSRRRSPPPDEVQKSLSRRTLLKSIGVGAGALASGCFGNLRLSEGELRARSEALVAAVDHIVILMMENRSFDHIFGALSMDPAYPGRGVVDGLRGSEWNPDLSGAQVLPSQRVLTVTDDPPHGWKQSHAQFNGGRNDGFVTEAEKQGLKSPALVMQYFNRFQLPILYALADQYTVCDRWFSSVLGPTWPNRFYMHATTSWGEKGYGPHLDMRVITVSDLMRSAGRTAKLYYAGGISWYSGGFLLRSILDGNKAEKPQPLKQFFKDAAAGNLPDLSIIDPDFNLSDDHPPHDVRLGQSFVGTIVQAVADSPNWARTLMVITYDEHGGFYDHVPPPAVNDDRPDFAQLGFRVPTLLVGPMVRAGAVHSVQYEHSSIGATLAARYGLPSLTTRMAEAEDLGGAIDPDVISGRAQPLDKPRLPTLEMARGQILTTLGNDSQPELTALMEKVPKDHINTASAEQRMDEWLSYANHFEVLKVK